MNKSAKNFENHDDTRNKTTDDAVKLRLIQQIEDKKYIEETFKKEFIPEIK